MQSLFSQMLALHPCWPQGHLPDKARERFYFGPELPQALARCFSDALQTLPNMPPGQWNDFGKHRNDAARKRGPFAPYGYHYAPPLPRQRAIPISS